MAAGDRNWKEFVGPAQRWDSQAAFQFVSLIDLGLRGHHRLCDVGCGSLRAGRLLIPFLDPGCYYGIEPEKWLVEEGLKRHVGVAIDLSWLKQPRFILERTDFPIPAFNVDFDFILAQSVLTHADPDQVREFLGNAAVCLAKGGRIVANWQESQTGRSFEGKGWQYPHCVPYTEHFMRNTGEDFGLTLNRMPMKAAGLACSWGIWSR